MTEEKFLEQYIFEGLQNLNTGFDSNTIWHFSEEDFETVMDRVEEYGVTVLGLECWTRNKFRSVKYQEDYKDVENWHRNAFKTLRTEDQGCVFSATYEIPPELLKA